MKTVVSMLMLVLVACLPQTARELTAHERAAHAAALAAWQEAGLPAMKHCSVSKLRIRRGDCGVGKTACLRWDRGQPIVQIVPDHQIEPNGEPIIHELMHAQFNCSHAEGWNVWALNQRHGDPRVWVQGGAPDSAQGRARAKVLPTP